MRQRRRTIACLVVETSKANHVRDMEWFTHGVSRVTVRLLYEPQLNRPSVFVCCLTHTVNPDDSCDTVEQDETDAVDDLSRVVSGERTSTSEDGQ